MITLMMMALNACSPMTATKPRLRLCVAPPSPSDFTRGTNVPSSLVLSYELHPSPPTSQDAPIPSPPPSCPMQPELLHSERAAKLLAEIASTDAVHPRSFQPLLDMIAQELGCGRSLLVLPAALPLAAAFLVSRERLHLHSALYLLRSHAGEHMNPFLTPAISSLLRLEMSVHGEPSDLSSLEGGRWAYTKWEESNAAVTVCRGRLIRAQRIRPEPRMAWLLGFITADEAEHIVWLAKGSGKLHPSRVANHEGGDGVISMARTSQSCKLCAKSRISWEHGL